jgi:chloride channel protein, CIC family
LRDSDLFLLVLAVGAGVAAGIGVVLIDFLLAGLRWFAFAIPRDGHLSDIDLGPGRVLLMPVLGGLLVGLAAALLRRWRQRAVIDAIEANALFGGRMSVGDSLGLVGVTALRRVRRVGRARSSLHATRRRARVAPRQMARLAPR